MLLTYLPDSERIHCKAEERFEYLALKKWFARRKEGYMFDTRFKLKLWDGYTYGFHTETDTVELGLWKEVVKMCQEFGYPFKFTNKEQFPINRDVKKAEAVKWMQEFLATNLMDERAYQLRVASNILKDRYCNIAVATSGGKTFIFSLVLFWLLANGHSDKKFLLVVPSKTLVNQFYDDILKYNNGRFDLNIQEIFGEKPRITDPSREPNLVIGTFQSLAGEIAIEKKDKNRPDKKIKKVAKYNKEWFKQFWSITGDEGHKSAGNSYKKIFKATRGSAYYRWGMSGTFPKDDSEEMMNIMKHTGPVIDTVKARELMDNGYITKVKIKGILINHNDYDFANQLEIVAKRDGKSCYDLECAKIQDCEGRLKIINKIVKECKQNTLVLFHNTEYGQLLLETLKKNNPDKIFHYIDGSISNKERNIIKADMEQTDQVRILVASFGCLAVGVSINAITNVVFTQSFKKAQVIIQAIGRALRLHPDKPMAYIFDLVDVFNPHPDQIKRHGKYAFKNKLFGHWQQRLKIYLEEEYPTTQLEINL